MKPAEVALVLLALAVLASPLVAKASSGSNPSRARFEANVRRWQPMAQQASAASGVPLAWILGIIWAESGGNPNARSPVGAIGLMQLYSPEARAGYSDAALLDPATNISTGAAYLKRITRSGDTLAMVASKYNAGQTSDGAPHPSSSSPYGYREQPGYIARVLEGAALAGGAS